MTDRMDEREILAELRRIFDRLVRWAQTRLEARGSSLPPAPVRIPSVAGEIVPTVTLAEVAASTMSALSACVCTLDVLLLSSQYVGALASPHVRDALRISYQTFTGAELEIPVSPSLAGEAETLRRIVDVLCLTMRHLCDAIGSTHTDVIRRNRIVLLEAVGTKRLVLRTTYNPFTVRRTSGRHDSDDSLADVHAQCTRAVDVLSKYLGEPEVRSTRAVVDELGSRRASPSSVRRGRSPLVDVVIPEDEDSNEGDQVDM